MAAIHGYKPIFVLTEKLACRDLTLTRTVDVGGKIAEIFSENPSGRSERVGDWLPWRLVAGEAYPAETCRGDMDCGNLKMVAMLTDS